MDLPLRASNEHILIVRVPRAQKIISLHPLPLLAAFFNILLVGEQHGRRRHRKSSHGRDENLRSAPLAHQPRGEIFEPTLPLLALRRKPI
jgi:hypothetical protein